MRDLQQVLREVLELEDRGRAALEERRQAVAGEIRRIGRSREAHAAYGAVSAPAAPRGVVDNRC